MALSSYTELQDSVATWINRTNLTSSIPDFIAIAESRINADVRLRQGIVTSTLTTVSNQDYVDLPDDWLEFKALSISGKPLHYVPADRVRDKNGNDSVRGTPTEYSIEGDSLLLTPGPSTTALTIDIKYYAKLVALATTPTNWLLTLYPNIYLYGSLVSAYQFMMDENRANYYGGLYTQAIAVAHGSNARALSSGSPLQVRPR